jgi:hypothetical protein
MAYIRFNRCTELAVFLFWEEHLTFSPVEVGWCPTTDEQLLRNDDGLLLEEKQGSRGEKFALWLEGEAGGERNLLCG